MICFPNCKINIGLYVTEKRADGFHNLETVFYPINNVTDALEVLDSTNGATEITTTGVPLQIFLEQNIVYKAYLLLKEKFNLPASHFHLHKGIPHGAGLGGGSADAAFTLQLLNKKFGLQIANTELQNMAAMLGSDCAFFIQNTPCFGTGRGEVLEPFSLDLSAYQVCLVKPQVHIPTAAAFQGITPTKAPHHLPTILQQPIETWQNEVINSFEKPIFAKFPEAKAIKDFLMQSGAKYASLSGSGSTVYGIFPERKMIEIPNTQIFWSTL